MSESKVILLVEDNPDDVELARQALKELGKEEKLAVARDVHPYQLFRYPTVVATKAAMVTLANRLKPAKA